MSTFYRKGLLRNVDNVKKMKASTSTRPEFEKRLFLKKDEAQVQVVLLAPSLDDVPSIYDHTVFIPNDKTSYSLHVGCSYFDEGEAASNPCPICQEQLFNDNIKRTFLSLWGVVDCRVYNIDGKQWTHGVTTWAAKKTLTTLIVNEIQNKAGGKTFGALLEIGRVGENSPSCGNHVVFKGHVNSQFFLSSPRLQWFAEKYYKTNGVKLTAQQAAGMYFKVPEFEKYFEPTRERVNYFLSYCKRHFGSGGTFGNGSNSQSQSGDPMSFINQPSNTKADMTTPSVMGGSGDFVQNEFTTPSTAPTTSFTFAENSLPSSAPSQSFAENSSFAPDNTSFSPPESNFAPQANTEVPFQGQSQNTFPAVSPIVPQEPSPTYDPMANLGVSGNSLGVPTPQAPPQSPIAPPSSPFPRETPPAVGEGFDTSTQDFGKISNVPGGVSIPPSESSEVEGGAPPAVTVNPVSEVKTQVNPVDFNALAEKANQK